MGVAVFLDPDTHWRLVELHPNLPGEDSYLFEDYYHDPSIKLSEARLEKWLAEFRRLADQVSEDETSRECMVRLIHVLAEAADHAKTVEVVPD